MNFDMHGLEVTTDTPATLRAINAFIQSLLAYGTEAPGILVAAEAEPDGCLVNAYAGMLWMFLESPEAPSKARSFLDKALAATEQATEREAMIARAINAWALGEIPTAIELCGEIGDRWPRDLVMLKLGQGLLFDQGDSAGMLRMALKALPGAKDIAYTHGMIAFGYEQCHLLEEAEKAARLAMKLLQDEPWAHHATAHVMLTQGRIDEGISFLESVCDSWADLNSFMHTHNWWHLALFYLSRERNSEVLEIYDTHIWGLSKDYSQDQIGAVSMLARMEFAGLDVGARWADVADHIAQRGRDTVNPFLTMQYLYALSREGRAEAGMLMDAVRDRAADTSRHDQMVWQDVALPACEGILAYARGDWATCLNRLGQALPRMAEGGGSHAQRDLFEQIHLQAMLNAGKLSQAQQVLEMRRGYDPDGGPLNRTLARVYRDLGLPGLAKTALARIA